KNIPKISIAISGGEYRTAQYGAGVLSRLDACNNSAKQGDTDGLLQMASYLPGLSCGLWLIGSLYVNDSPIPNDLVYENSDGMIGWQLDLDFATPREDNILSDQNQHCYENILWGVMAKDDTSIDTNLANPWVHMISYRFLNQTDRKNFFTNDSTQDADQLWSRVSMTPSWPQYLVPFP
ncbi:lysophospholipase, partial [Lactarius vividus]